MRLQVHHRGILLALALTTGLAQPTTAFSLEFPFLCPDRPGPQPASEQIRSAIIELRAAVQEKSAIEEADAQRQEEESRKKTGDLDPTIMVAVEAKAWDPGDRLANIKLDLCNLDLSGQDLSQLDFSGFRIENVKFSRARLDGANLSASFQAQEGMDFSGASLRGAHLSGNLDRANFNSADLTDARFTYTNLREASLLATNVSGTLLDVDMTGSSYAPLGAAPSPLSRIGGLESVVYPRNGENGVIQLREFFQKNGRRDDERKATHAIERNTTSLMMLHSVAETIEGAFRFVAFDLTTAYGLHPGRALLLIFLFMLLLTPYYATVIERPWRGGKVDGIYLVLPSDRIASRQGAPSTGGGTKITRLRRAGASAWKWAAYFSLLSAFHVGFREFNVGTWIARVQRKPFRLDAVGGVRTVSGAQSLLSLFLLAMWLLTYFGRPFQ